jgi:hypothetical protein
MRISQAARLNLIVIEQTNGTVVVYPPVSIRLRLQSLVSICFGIIIHNRGSKFTLCLQRNRDDWRLARDSAVAAGAFVPQGFPERPNGVVVTCPLSMLLRIRPARPQRAA